MGATPLTKEGKPLSKVQACSEQTLFLWTEGRHFYFAIFGRDNFMRESFALFFVGRTKAIDGIGPRFNQGTQWVHTSSHVRLRCIVVKTLEKVMRFSFEEKPPKQDKGFH
jgi:hypothetical protein